MNGRLGLLLLLQLAKRKPKAGEQLHGRIMDFAGDAAAFLGLVFDHRTAEILAHVAQVDELGHIVARHGVKNAALAGDAVDAKLKGEALPAIPALVSETEA